MNKTTAIIFFGIILVGLAISLFTLRGCGKKEELAAIPAGIASVPDEERTSPPIGEAKSDRAPEGDSEPPAPATPVPAPTAVAPVTSPFRSPAAAVAALAERVGAKDFEGFAKLVGPSALVEPVRGEVKALVENSDLTLDPSNPQVEISKSAEGLRWALNFVPVSGEKSARQLYADLKEAEDGSVEIAKVSLPLEPSVSPGGASPTSAAGSAAASPADALTVAHTFSKAVVERDFKTARELADPGSVTDERVAALMIAIEEGEFELRAERPFVVTLAREDITWVLARIQSEGMASEFAVELGKVGEAWKVNGLTFSKVLSALSEAAGGGDIAYSPIVEDPAGGDSLVLYFEFDDSGLTSRTKRQLAIVADILKQGQERVIRINGHTDSLGSADYNIGLSDRRAESIRKELVANGVKPEQVVTEAFGAAKPRKPNFLPDGSDNPKGRSENRRAEVLLDF